MLKGLELSAQDLLARLVLLPPPLRAVVESEEDAKAIETICRGQGVTDEDKILAAQQVFCFSLLGLVKPSDIAAELNDILELNDLARAEKIASAGRAKVFAGIENVVAQNYSPEILRPPAPGGPVASPVVSPRPAPAVPSALSPALAPVVIHREAEVAAVKPPADAGPKLPTGDLLSKVMPAPAPKPPAARLEIGKPPEKPAAPPAPAVARTEVAPPRVVNYGAPTTPPASADAAAGKGGAVSLGDIVRRPPAPPPPAAPVAPKTPTIVPPAPPSSPVFSPGGAAAGKPAPIPPPPRRP